MGLFYIIMHLFFRLFGYVKFLALWGLVLLADFLLEFRFEYLYPVYLLGKSAQDSYKYQGMVGPLFPAFIWADFRLVTVLLRAYH